MGVRGGCKGGGGSREVRVGMWGLCRVLSWQGGAPPEKVIEVPTCWGVRPGGEGMPLKGWAEVTSKT